MPTLSRLLVAAALLLVAAPAASALSQTASKEAKEATRSVITGRVTTHGDEPLPGIGLVLIPQFSRDRQQKPAGRATTGPDGFYRMANVPPGSYHLQVLAPAHTSADASAMFNGPREVLAVNVAAGERIEKQDFTLARGSVITGRVTDADGKPLIGEYIRLTSAVAGDGNSSRRSGGGGDILPYAFETDDRGVYRVYGLPAGRYLVSVGIDKEIGMVRTTLSGKNFTRTFHPDTTEEAQAKAVEVSAGGEAKDIDITLAPPLKTYEATGHALDAETGRPVADVFYGFGVLNADNREMNNRGFVNSKTNAGGEFSLRNLLPGRYAVFVHSRNGDAPNYYSDATPFEITDGNISDLVLKVRRGATLSGVAVVEGATNRAALAKLSQITFYVNVRPNESKAGELQVSNSSQVRLQADGSFRLTGLPPGKAQFHLEEYNLPKGFTLLRVERGGVEQSGDAIEVGAGEQVTGVRLHLVYGVSVLRGQVEVRRDGAVAAQLPAGGRLWVSLRRLNANSSRNSNGAQVDGRGRFIIEGLAAGEYELMTNVWIQSAPGAHGGTPLATIRQTINVPEKGETSVTVIYDLDMKTQQQPRPIP